MQRDKCTDADAVIFKKFARQRTVKKQNRGGAQGHYAVTPSGILLAASSHLDADAVAAMLEEALEKWEALPREQRLLPKAPDPAVAEGWRKQEQQYPEDGLVLRVFSRDLERKRWPDWNQDFAWFRKAEARGFLPNDPKPGDRYAVPRDLVERLVQFHLLDNVYALNYTFFPKEAIENAGLTAIVNDVDSARISLRFEGATRAAIKGDKAIGFAPKLLGKASWSLEQERFTAFELVAVGDRWGLGSCNRRSNPKPAPMGIVFTLANDRPADRLPPAFLSRYGW